MIDDIVDGFITVRNDSFRINETSSNHHIDSFKEKIPYDFNIEHLPLDDLIENNNKLSKTIQCDQNRTINSWLKCLQSEEKNVELKECQDNVQLSFSYSYNNANKYNITLSPPKSFNHRMNFKCIKKILNL